MKKIFTAIIYKEFGTTVKVEAENMDEAYRIIKEKYKNGEYDNNEFELTDVDIEMVYQKDKED